MSQANVRSVDALKQFKHALITFQEEGRNALTSMELDIRQTRNWLERDQMSFWKAQVKKWLEGVNQAKSDLYRRQLSQQNSDSVSDADQKEALRIAKRKLAEAEEMVERIKRWIPVLEHATAEYHSQSQPLGDRLAGGLVTSIMLLEKMIISIEEYLAISVPIAPVTASTGGGSAGAGAAAPKTAVTSSADGAATTVPANGAEAGAAAAAGNGQEAGSGIEAEETAPAARP